MRCLQENLSHLWTKGALWWQRWSAKALPAVRGAERRQVALPLRSRFPKGIAAILFRRVPTGRSEDPCRRKRSPVLEPESAEPREGGAASRACRETHRDVVPREI